MFTRVPAGWVGLKISLVSGCDAVHVHAFVASIVECGLDRSICVLRFCGWVEPRMGFPGCVFLREVQSSIRSERLGIDSDSNNNTMHPFSFSLYSLTHTQRTAHSTRALQRRTRRHSPAARLDHASGGSGSSSGDSNGSTSTVTTTTRFEDPSPAHPLTLHPSHRPPTSQAGSSPDVT